MEEDWDAELDGTSEPAYQDMPAYKAPEAYSPPKRFGNFNSENRRDRDRTDGWSRGGAPQRNTDDQNGQGRSGFGRRGRGRGFHDRGDRNSDSQSWRQGSASGEDAGLKADQKGESRSFTKYGEETSLSVESQYVGRIIGLLRCFIKVLLLYIVEYFCH